MDQSKGAAVRALAKQITRHLPLTVGYGLYLGYYPLGPIGAASITTLAGTWQQVLLARMAFVVATVAAIITWKAVSTRHQGWRSPRANRISFAVALVSVLVMYLVVPPDAQSQASMVFLLVFGAATATPKLACYEAFCDVYRSEGRTGCIVALAMCFLVAALVTPLTNLMHLGPLASCGVLTVLVAASAVCMDFMERSPLRPPSPDPATLRQDYHVSAYTLVILVSFGITWLFTFSVAIDVGFGTGLAHSSTWGVIFAGIVVDVVIVVVFSCVRSMVNVRFGLILRWIVAAVGTIWAVMPLLAGSAPALASFLCSSAYVVQGMVMILFIAEVCNDYNISVCTVTMVHYGIFIAAAAAGAVVYWLLFTYVDTRTAYEILAAIAVISSLAVVPMLPSRSSKAAVFVLDELPEDDCYEDRVARARTEIAARANLSEREIEVFSLLLDGCSREEMAQILTISPWTVKRHVASIYEKTGTHSMKELLVLVSGDTTGTR